MAVLRVGSGLAWLRAGLPLCVRLEGHDVRLPERERPANLLGRQWVLLQVDVPPDGGRVHVQDLRCLSDRNQHVVFPPHVAKDSNCLPSVTRTGACVSQTQAV